MTEQSFFLKINDDGRPGSNPILEQNLIDLIRDFDPKNPPKGFVKFFKTPIPEIHPYERYEYLDYEHSPELSEKYGQETWHEVHHITRITETEKKEIIDQFKKLNPQLKNWIFDETSMNLIPPVPKPNDGKEYFWNTDVEAWQEDKSSLYFQEVLDLAKQLGIDLHSAKHGKPIIDEKTMKDLIGMINLGK